MSLPSLYCGWVFRPSHTAAITKMITIPTQKNAFYWLIERVRGAIQPIESILLASRSLSLPLQCDSAFRHLSETSVIACCIPIYAYMHKIINLWTFWLNWSLKLQENYGIKNTLVAQICLFSDSWEKASGLKPFNIWVRKNTSFLKTT